MKEKEENFFSRILSIGYRYFRLDKKSVNDKCVVKLFK